MASVLPSSAALLYQVRAPLDPAGSADSPAGNRGWDFLGFRHTSPRSKSRGFFVARPRREPRADLTLYRFNCSYVAYLLGELDVRCGDPQDPTALAALSRAGTLSDALSRLSEPELEVLAAVVLQWPMSRLARLRGEPVERTRDRLSKRLSKLSLDATNRMIIWKLSSMAIVHLLACL
jgi:hypothetical protein